MTELQKFIIDKLLEGCNISGNPRYGYRLRQADATVLRKFHHKTFLVVKKLLRKKGDFFLIDKNKVRQLHGKSFAKKAYKTIVEHKKIFKPV